MVRGLFLCTSLVVAMGVGAQTVYKSVGPDGKVVYGDSPPTEGRLDRKMKFDKLRASPLRPPTRAPAQQLGRSATAVTPVTGSVVLYSASWCGYCKAAKAYLGARGIAYREMDVVTDAGQAAYVQAGGRNGVPLLVAGGQRVERFSPAAYDAVFQVRR